jgi:predicted site-specific integrase-resolvase
MYVTPRQAREHYKVSEKTLKRWSDSGKIKFINTKGLHRRYLIEDTTNETERNFIYARVSSRKQSGDLQRQIEYLSAKIEGADIISDIGSGFNYNRPGFQRIIKEVIKGGVSNVYVSYPDRFTRISFDFFKWLFKHFGTKLIALSKSQMSEGSNADEFTEDIIGIITHYTAKYYGKRKYREIKSPDNGETTSS